MREDDEPEAPPHDQKHAEPLGPATPDSERPLGDTPEAHDEISAHDVPKGSPERQAVEHDAERRGGATSGTGD